MVPLDDPSEARYLHLVPTGEPDMPPEELHPCHDTGVILGDVKKVSCAGGSGPTVWTVDPREGGSLENPRFLFHRDLGTQIGHSASWSWDGEVLIFGHEPGGGTQARCQATSSTLDRTLFILDGDTGETLSEFLHPRPQTALETARGTTTTSYPRAGRECWWQGTTSRASRSSTSAIPRIPRRSRTPTRPR